MQNMFINIVSEKWGRATDLGLTSLSLLTLEPTSRTITPVNALFFWNLCLKLCLKDNRLEPHFNTPILSLRNFVNFKCKWHHY